MKGQYQIPYNQNYCEWCLSDLAEAKKIIKKPYGKFCCQQCYENYVWCRTTRTGGLR